jgi:hypothetical protein
MRVFILLFGSLFVGLCCGFLTFLSLVPTIIYVSPKNSSPVVISRSPFGTAFKSLHFQFPFGLLFLDIGCQKSGALESR